ncbi:hypothetical protein [Bradyrhizobium canariense]|uniref:Uncharacterized protein n=1 Tax=Bradyrhizobium canariense TaxID=255045 RepID=A0A1X3GUN7_9BRAD|nr:hypothetical protein [Bradyrhizobium canariense]OSI67865.1 hypothetical protein BSZ22_22360 [Bradyrhizobium canariense]OSI76631.1 hypothetical protein BSZ23_24110 [Bradyrhizobium canariense]OSI89740.1 hypothetical protein BSZ24_21485 [Bradyrhizobium canariense]OSI90811.1 hypothetical protein BSZ25_16630 [Bradyrhizobium canariense]OSJ01186.1 hypothetical protein BSZ16_21365 [Bradyrhizobium canariense]
MNSGISSPSHRENRFYQGMAATFVANALQAVNFLSDRFLRQSHHPFTAIENLYRHSIDSAFAVSESFLVTGAPHASAYYPRDFAWFYPDILDPDTILDSQDAVRRARLLEKSVRLLLEAVRANVVTTTIVPAGRARYLGVNYFSRPSDTLLGILAGLQQMISAEERASSYLAMSQCVHAGRLLLAEYCGDLNRAILQLASELEPFNDDGSTYLLCDASAPRSAATDTRAERRRFVTNACVYTTFVWGVRLGIIDENELKRRLGRDLAQHKRDLLRLFGKGGYIRHSLDGPPGSPVSSVALDFVSVHRGFWDMNEPAERALFAATADLIIAEPRFRIPGTFHFLVSADNPRNKMIHKIAAPAYQGRSSWPTFNVEFADRMLDYDEFSCSDTYRSCAQGILKDIRTATEVHSGYQELISERGLKYRTWAYKGAVAHSWFPRFLSVWRRAHGTPLLQWND